MMTYSCCFIDTGLIYWKKKDELSKHLHHHAMICPETPSLLFSEQFLADSILGKGGLGTRVSLRLQQR